MSPRDSPSTTSASGAAPPVAIPAAYARPRRPLFWKYFLALFVAVIVPLSINGASEAWFGYRDYRDRLS